MCTLLSKLYVASAELSDIDIIALSETHLDNSITDDDISLTGCHIPIRKDKIASEKVLRCIFLKAYIFK